jgi:hypothetical protein
MLALLWGMQPLQAAPAASHDFDFVLGNWKARISHRQHSPGAADRWEVWNGSVMAARVWGGRANLQQIEVHAPSGTIEELRLSLYRPLVHQWYLYWADSSDGVLDKPMIGRFKDGVGSFYDQEDYNGRAIFVRQQYSAIGAHSYRWQQAFSDDGGGRWQPNWNVVLTRESMDGADGAKGTESPASDVQAHGFDFAWGDWRTEISFLPDPFAGSSHWVQIRGQVRVRKVWGGRANLEEIEASGAHGPFEGLTLRLYDPKAQQWNLYWANSNDSVLDEPMIGSFKDGRGVFYNQDTYAGRTAFVRNVYFDVEADSYRFEQALSIDGGRTWRTNFIAHVTRKKS